MELKQYFNSKKWTFAKTYAARAPHEYLLRQKDDIYFMEAVKVINENGFKAKFWNSEYTYFYLDGYLYWTMDYPLETTKLINRCSLENYELSVKLKKEALTNGNNV